MKTKAILTTIFFTILTFSSFSQNKEEVNTKVLLGEWRLDMSPQNTEDNNFAMMRITDVTGNTLKGTFYREGVQLKNGQINTQTGVIHVALTSGDNSGQYNSSFYYKNGKLYGTTHALKRNFLAVWVAERAK